MREANDIAAVDEDRDEQPIGQLGQLMARSKHQQPHHESERRQQERTRNERRKAEREIQELRRQLPGLESLLGFFRAADVSVELRPGRWLWINGIQAKHLTHLPPAETLEWSSTVSEIALKDPRRTFIRAIAENAHFGEGIRVILVRRENGFAVMSGDARLAVIHAARAQIPHREGIRANFLIRGVHWRLLADVILETEADVVSESNRQGEAGATAEASDLGIKTKSRRAVRRHIDRLPDGLDPDLTRACLEASRRIRLERQVAYDRPVILESEVGELTLLPIERIGSRLLMPFRITYGRETLSGELVLGDHDPLALLVGEGVADEDAISAWTSALLGFADATCVDLEQTGPPVQRNSAIPRPRRSPSVASVSPSSRTVPRTRRWPSYLEPIGHWVRYSGSFVAGHRRYLQEGQKASEEAQDRARQVGIILHPQETWVRPHARGIPEGIELRFLWHPSYHLQTAETRGGTLEAAGPSESYAL